MEALPGFEPGRKGFASLCRSYGYQARRGQQYAGANGDADVVGLPGIHIEVKRVERLDLLGAMSQSKADAKKDELPIVAHRRDNAGWLITMDAEDWFTIFNQFFSQQQLQQCKED